MAPPTSARSVASCCCATARADRGHWKDCPDVDDRSDRIAALLHEAGETHHIVYRIVDGEDPDWASWYADWLLDHSELPGILQAKPVRSELVWLLVGLDNEYTRQSPQVPWPRWYAQRIIGHFGSAAG
jgi:hypothetical protein